METVEFKPVKLTSSGVRYEVRHRGQVIIKSSRVPTMDAARYLRDAGFDGKMQTKHAGSDRIMSTGPIEWFADKTISEGADHGPRVAKFREFDVDAATFNA